MKLMSDNIIDNVSPDELHLAERIWIYTHGLFMCGLQRLYEQTGDEKYLLYTKKWADSKIDDNGEFYFKDMVDKWGFPYLRQQLDAIQPGLPFFKLYEIYKEEITKAYPNIAEKQVQKLAMENARYLISVFTPATTMEYTVSCRQLNYIIQFFKNYIAEENETEFSIQLKPFLQEFIDLTKEFAIEGLNANEKAREISLFAKREYAEEYGECYSTNYKGTFAQLAQAQRHRTLRYKMDINEFECYIPEIIENNEKLKEDWKKDMESLKDRFPQGMLININEYKEYLKIKEAEIKLAK